MSTEQNTAAVRRMIDEAWNGRNLAVVDELVSPDYAGRDPSFPAPIQGPAGFNQWMSTAHTAFPDFHITIDQIVSENDLVALRMTLTGTNTGSLMGMPPTGKTIHMTGSAIRRFRDGRMIEGWDNSDSVGMMQQLGLMPGN